MRRSHSALQLEHRMALAQERDRPGVVSVAGISLDAKPGAQHLHPGQGGIPEEAREISHFRSRFSRTRRVGCSAVNARLDRRLLFKLVTSDRFERAVRSIPGGPALSWRWARRYVAGTELDDALARARELAASGIAASIDMFGERVGDLSEADRVVAGYVELAERVRSAAPPGTWLSLDLSHLAIATDAAGAAARLRSIVEALPAGARVQVGAEEAALADAILDAVLAVPNPSSITATLQANLRRSTADAERLARAGVPIRLVKGAYVEGSGVALPYGEPTDLNYLALADRLGKLDAEVMLATHDGVLREACRHLLPSAGVEMLLGYARRRRLALPTPV